MVVFLNKVDMMDDEELLELVELEVRELLSQVRASRATTSRSCGAVGAGRRWRAAATDPTAPEYAPILELMQAVDDYIPTPERAVDQPFLMPIEDVFGIKGRGTVVTGRIERGHGQGRGGDRDRRASARAAQDGGDRGGDVPEDCWTRGRPGTTWAACCAGWSATEVRAGAGAGQAGLDHARTPSSRPRSTC